MGCICACARSIGVTTLERPAARLPDAERYQCASREPESASWDKLTTVDPSAFVVLTRAVTPLHWALTARFWVARQNLSRTNDPLDGDDINASIAYYTRYLEAVRAEHRRNPRYVRHRRSKWTCLHIAHTVCVLSARVIISYPCLHPARCWQFEICFGCGDDGFTLARSLGLDPATAMRGISPKVRINRHLDGEDAARIELLRRYADRLVD